VVYSLSLFKNKASFDDVNSVLLNYIAAGGDLTIFYGRKTLKKTRNNSAATT
jgi:hypothetical protein